MELPLLNSSVGIADDPRFDFHSVARTFGLSLKPLAMETMQVNITKLCNQACQHCHVDASPKRTEQMDLGTVDRCLEILAGQESITTLDLTGGAPELNPHFDYFVTQAKTLGKHIIVRHNLTVTFDGNPQTGESKHYLPEFFAENTVEIIASLPCYTEENTDKQRGRGAFEKSIEGIQRLNSLGYGIAGTGLMLNLVYNPIGASLPPEQKKLEAEYKQQLLTNFGIQFNNLFTITNMPIHRFKEWLDRAGSYEAYMTTLVNTFNPSAAEGIMCRTMISIGYDGRLYDCDFNQMLDLPVRNGKPKTIFDEDFEALLQREIIFGSHCFGCTAGAGSSCAGTLS